MAGDLNTTEYAMILGRRTRGLESAPPETIPCVHRYGPSTYRTDSSACDVARADDESGRR